MESQRDWWTFIWGLNYTTTFEDSNTHQKTLANYQRHFALMMEKGDVNGA